MEYIDLKEFIKRDSKNIKKKKGSIRYNIDTIGTSDEVYLIRNHKSATQGLMDYFTVSRLVDELGDPAKLPDTNGIYTMGELRKYLKGKKLILGEPRYGMGLSVMKSNVSDESLGAFLGYTSGEDEYGDINNTTIMDYLRVDSFLRNKGVSKRLIQDLEKFIRINVGDSIKGCGRAIDKSFCIEPKNDEERAFIEYLESQYPKCTEIRSIDKNLALFYHRLGFEIYPKGEHFTFRKGVSVDSITSGDKVFLGNCRNTLDEGNILVGR